MKKPRRIVFLATLIFLIGINIAYYNTSSLVREKVNFISFDNESVRVYETDIRYDDVKKHLEKIKNRLVKKVFFKEENAMHTTEFYELDWFLYKCCFYKIAGRNINNLRYADDTNLVADSEANL